MSKLKTAVAIMLAFTLLYSVGTSIARSAEELIGKTETMSPLVWFCDSPDDLDVLLSQTASHPAPDKIPGCRKFEDGALVTIHAIEVRKIPGAEAVLLRVSVYGYGTQYIVYDWRHVIAREM